MKVPEALAESLRKHLARVLKVDAERLRSAVASPQVVRVGRANPPWVCVELQGASRSEWLAMWDEAVQWVKRLPAGVQGELVVRLAPYRRVSR